MTDAAATSGAATDAAARLRAAFDAPDGSSRVQSAMSAGTYPRPEYIDVLVAQCAHEPDFTVRETLTWALTRQEREATLARVISELTSTVPQARSQALHTVSKLRDERAFAAITPELLRDPHPLVATTAWRAATVLAPDDAKPALADELSRWFGAGSDEMRRSLSRAFVALGAAGQDAIDRAAASAEWDVRVHALATDHLLAFPEDGFEAAMAAVRRAAARRDAAEWNQD